MGRRIGGASAPPARRAPPPSPTAPENEPSPAKARPSSAGARPPRGRPRMSAPLRPAHHAERAPCGGPEEETRRRRHRGRNESPPARSGASPIPRRPERVPAKRLLGSRRNSGAAKGGAEAGTTAKREQMRIAITGASLAGRASSLGANLSPASTRLRLHDPRRALNGTNSMAHVVASTARGQAWARPRTTLLGGTRSPRPPAGRAHRGGHRHHLSLA